MSDETLRDMSLRESNSMRDMARILVDIGRKLEEKALSIPNETDAGRRDAAESEGDRLLLHDLAHKQIELEECKRELSEARAENEKREALSQSLMAECHRLLNDSGVPTTGRLPERIQALIADRDDQRNHVHLLIEQRNEADSALMRLPKPPEAEGDGPDERVSHALERMRSERDVRSVLEAKLRTLQQRIQAAISEPVEIRLGTEGDQTS